MNVKDNKGFSLVELLVAIAIMAAFVIPTCSAFVLTARMNNKTDEMMQAQLAVSSAVETLMAEGIDQETLEDFTETEQDINGVKVKIWQYEDPRFPTVRILVSEVYKEKDRKNGEESVSYELMPWYQVEVETEDESVKVTTSIGMASSQTAGGNS